MIDPRRLAALVAMSAALLVALGFARPADAGASRVAPTSAARTIDPHAAPDTLISVEADHYAVAVRDRVFTYAVGTGPEHPVTAFEGRRVNVTVGGWNLRPQLSFQSLRSWTSGTDYLLGHFGDVFADPAPFDCAFVDDLTDPIVEEIVRDGQPVGIFVRWEVDAADRFAAELRLVVRGDGFEDGAVEVTTRIENLGDAPLRLGVRQHWAPNIVTDLEPGYGFAPPHPPEEPFLEVTTDFPEPDFHHWVGSVLSNQRFGETHYLVAGTVRGPATLDPPPTPPERLLISRWSIGPRAAWEAEPTLRGPGNSCFGGDATPGVELGTESSITYWWGETQATALEAAPGETVAVTQYLWAYLENPLACDAGAPLTVECQGAETAAVLDGSASTTDEGNTVRHAWSSDDPSVRIEDAESARPTYLLPGLGEHAADLEVGIGPYVATCATSIDVQDTTPPELDVPAPIVLRLSETGADTCHARAALEAEAFDRCAGDVDVTHVTIPNVGSGGATASHDFPLGTTRVVFEAVDPSGNRSSAETSVTVVDDVAPRFAVLRVEPPELWPPNHRLVDVEVDAEVIDACDPSPILRLTGVTSSEPADARGDGATRPDVVGADLGTDDRSLAVRAERDGAGPGRTYGIRYEAADASGNVTRAERTVVVPHDRRRTP